MLVIAYFFPHHALFWCRSWGAVFSHTLSAATNICWVLSCWSAELAVVACQVASIFGAADFVFSVIVSTEKGRTTLQRVLGDIRRVCGDYEPIFRKFECFDRSSLFGDCFFIFYECYCSLRCLSIQRQMRASDWQKYNWRLRRRRAIKRRRRAIKRRRKANN